MPVDVTCAGKPGIPWMWGSRNIYIKAQSRGLPECKRLRCWVLPHRRGIGRVTSATLIHELQI